MLADPSQPLWKQAFLHRHHFQQHDHVRVRGLACLSLAARDPRTEGLGGFHSSSPPQPWAEPLGRAPGSEIKDPRHRWATYNPSFISTCTANGVAQAFSFLMFSHDIPLFSCDVPLSHFSHGIPLFSCDVPLSHVLTQCTTSFSSSSCIIGGSASGGD